MKEQDYLEKIYKSPISNNNNILAIISTDKTGKGTTFRQSAYALSEIGYDVLGVPFPLYDQIDGLLIEIGLSNKHIREQLNKLEPKLAQEGINLARVRENLVGRIGRESRVSDKDKNYYADALENIFTPDTNRKIGLDYFLALYPANRLAVLDTIKEHQEKGYLILTKRSSKATHAAYQAGLNGFNEEEVMVLDDAFPDPMIIANLPSKEQLIKDFSNKGSATLDFNEARPQDNVITLQKKYTMQPQTVGAEYGYFINRGESYERLDDILKKTLPLLKEKGIKPNKKQGDLKIIGLEEPLYQFRETEGLLKFLRDYTNAQKLLGEEKRHEEQYGNLPSEERYEKLFTNPYTGLKDKHPFDVQGKIDAIIEDYK